MNLDSIVSNKNTSSSEDTTGSSSSERNNWPFRMLIIGPSGSGKTNTLLHLINNLHPIDKIYLYAKDIHEPNYEYLINKREQAGIKNLNDIEYNKNFKRIIKELFYRARKINVSIAFITQSYFRALKDARLNSTHYILMRIGNKKELKRIAEEKSGHLDYKDFFKMYNYCTKDPYSFMTIDTRPTATIQFKKTLMNQ